MHNIYSNLFKNKNTFENVYLKLESLFGCNNDVKIVSKNYLCLNILFINIVKIHELLTLIFFILFYNNYKFYYNY